ncbi:MAG: hypothetical protein ACTSPL_02655 [Candidatus Odinarchaeia archaeon]
MGLRALCEYALDTNAETVIIVGAYRGNPGSIKFLRISEGEFKTAPPIFKLAKAILIREISKAKLHNVKRLAIVYDEEVELLKTVSERLAEYLNVKDVWTFNTYENVKEKLDVVLKVYTYKDFPLVLDFKRGPKYGKLGPALYVKDLIWIEG